MNLNQKINNLKRLFNEQQDSSVYEIKVSHSFFSDEGKYDWDIRLGINDVWVSFQGESGYEKAIEYLGGE